jgi:hypothetical protein
VIWAGSIYHPVMLACGLTALIASLRGRWLVASLGAVGALLAHEGGFVFALILGGLHIALAVQRRRRLAIPALLIGALGIAYPLLFRFVLGAARFAGDAPNALRPEDLWPNTLYFLQGFVPFVSARLRPIIGLTPQWPEWILGAVLITLPIGLLLAARARRLPLALAALAAWVVLVAPAIVGLDRQYVVNGPRLHYSASVAVAIFWSTAAMGMRGKRLKRGEGRGESESRRRNLLSPLFPLPSPSSPLSSLLPRLTFLLFLTAGCFDSAVFAHVALQEALAVSRTMFTVDRSLRELSPEARVLYINAPWYSGRASPHFLVGSEGMPIYQHDGTFPSTWIGAQSNTLRDTTFVRHDISLTHGEFWSYGSPGDAVDDAALTTHLLAADEIWRWDYDGHGVRARRVARITRNAPAPTNSAARLTAPDGAPGDVTIVHAEARHCDNRVLLTIEWHLTAPPVEPIGVKVHGFAADGTQVFNADAQPFMGLVPFTTLAPGTRLLETREIRLDRTKPVPHHIQLGLYRGADFAAFGDGAAVDVSESEE